jgi:uncharacterized protein (TIGR03084 family)
VEQAKDFLDESEALYALVAPLPADALGQPTAFKGWAINDIVRHLHTWNHAADLSLAGGQGFRGFLAQAAPHVAAGTVRVFERDWSQGLEGPALIETWREDFRAVAARFATVDPSLRVEWAGPSMSARSSITARIMETWAHGQEIYDALGRVRESTDRIRNIAVLGVNTYGWTFKVRRQPVPEPAPHVRLMAPSGDLWVYGEPSEVESIEGSAEAVCQVVTPTRNVVDTQHEVTGPNATAWMRNAQCFAGPPETPPAPGTRKAAAA